MSADGRPQIQIPKIEEIPAEFVNPAVTMLLEICHRQREENRVLQDEIARLKGLPPRPKIQPSALENQRGKGTHSKRGRRRRAGRRCRTVPVHETVYVKPAGLPPGSRFKGYQDFTVQDIQIEAHNTLYRLERWLTPSGEAMVGKLPPGLDGHYGVTIVAYILYQYYQARVTQPRLLEQLRECGIEISSGELSNILTQNKEPYHAEKEELLSVGLHVSAYVHVDDTGARHAGKTGYCTHIGNELFAYFQSTQSKSRINFLELLRAGRDEYVLSDEALAYMRAHKLPRAHLKGFAGLAPRVCRGQEAWAKVLSSLGVTDERHVRIATEGALLGCVIEGDIHPDLAIMSDDAGQFAVLVHILCWVHAERVLSKLVGIDDAQRTALEAARTEVWAIYRELKAYKEAPDEAKKAQIKERFDRLCTTPTCFVSLNQALQRMHHDKAALLLVLERPELPLQNNLSERDIREYVTVRKISGSTRSNEGRRCRDTFTSLKKTCRKLGISFWAYLKDRVRGAGQIPRLGEVVQKLATSHIPLGPAQPAGP
jgi:hypothetical protein